MEFEQTYLLEIFLSFRLLIFSSVTGIQDSPVVIKFVNSGDLDENPGDIIAESRHSRL